MRKFESNQSDIPNRSKRIIHSRGGSDLILCGEPFTETFCQRVKVDENPIAQGALRNQIVPICSSADTTTVNFPSTGTVGVTGTTLATQLSGADASQTIHWPHQGPLRQILQPRAHVERPHKKQ